VTSAAYHKPLTHDQMQLNQQSNINAAAILKSYCQDYPHWQSRPRCFRRCGSVTDSVHLLLCHAAPAQKYLSIVTICSLVIGIVFDTGLRQHHFSQHPVVPTQAAPVCDELCCIARVFNVKVQHHHSDPSSATWLKTVEQI